MSFSQRSKQPILIDGGLGTTLEEYGLTILNDPLWSGTTLVKQPEQLAQVHRAFVKSGCDIIVTATYQLSLDNLMKECQLTVEQAEEILFNSVQLARKSIEEEGSSCRVAASIGPYGAVLGDGSEFNGWYTDSMSIEQFKDWHRSRMAILARAQPDLFAFETIPSQKEAEALTQLLREFPNLKAWMSFNCQNTTSTAHGESIKDAAESICRQSPDQIIAVGVNCVHPDTIVPLMEQINQIDRDLIAYPNAGAVWNNEEKKFKNRGGPILPYIDSYIAAGVRYIGGCCHVNPNEIRAIRNLLDQRG